MTEKVKEAKNSSIIRLYPPENSLKLSFFCDHSQITQKKLAESFPFSMENMIFTWNYSFQKLQIHKENFLKISFHEIYIFTEETHQKDLILKQTANNL